MSSLHKHIASCFLYLAFFLPLFWQDSVFFFTILYKKNHVPCRKHFLFVLFLLAT